METHLFENNTALLREMQSYLISKGQTLCTAESCTGGLLASLLTHLEGSSQFYMGGVSAYANHAKIRLLEVPEAAISSFGAVSEEVAIAMAEGAMKKLGADFAISVTGIAGPGGGSEEKPVGTIFCGFASSKQASARKYSLQGTRQEIRESISTLALTDFFRYIQD